MKTLSSPRPVPFSSARLSVAFLSVFVLASFSAAENALTPEAKARAGESVTRGLDWLAGIQKPDGSWSNPDYPALTALGLWAFARSDHPKKAEVCGRAAAFVSGMAQPDDGIYKPSGGGLGGGLSTYNTAICMMALHACDREKYAPLILRARKFIARSQLTGGSKGAGGFGYDSSPPVLHKVMMAVSGRSRADLSNTGWALQAMRTTQDIEDLRPGGKTVDIDWDAALKFAEKMQNTDASDTENAGSFSYSSGGERGGTHTGTDGKVKLTGYGSMTYAGMEAMIYAEVSPSDPRVRSTLEWASRHWTLDENPGMGTKGLFYYYTILSKALTAAGGANLRRPDGTEIEWKKQLVDRLVSIQSPDGSWVNRNNQFWEGDAALVTAYSVLALEYAMDR